MMKINFSTTVQIIILLCAMECSSSKTAPENWEGISGNTLKITISEFFPLEEDVTSEEIKRIITERLSQRASLIMASHLSINIPRNRISQDTDFTLNKLINESIAGGRIADFECSENNYCRAHGEYDITQLQNTLESINNR